MENQKISGLRNEITIIRDIYPPDTYYPYSIRRVKISDDEESNDLKKYKRIFYYIFSKML